LIYQIVQLVILAIANLSKCMYLGNYGMY